ncbi:MAG: outer membrane lipoprotein-sorting protein [Nitrospirota bacterium]|nr:outer membrane lipoprotein-sorting protein [Nitrospirota bacterium]
MVISVFSSPAFAISGRDIFEKVHEVSVKGLDHEISMTMVLFDKNGGKRTRTLTSYSKNAAPEAYKALAVFKTPPDLKNVGFLVHARTFSNRDLWAYFPEFKRVRRIANTSQDDSFFGSDLSYDDFTGPANLDDFKFSLEREEVVDGKPCYVVEVTPKTRRKYTRYLAWVAKDLWVQVKIEYYQDRDIYRSGTFKNVRLINGIPTPFRSEMENRKTNHRTELTIDNIRYNTQFSDDLFTQRSLERAGK